MRRAQSVNKGFPKEAGWWTVYAKLPATRTMGTSYGEWDVDMVPQGERTPDYANKNYEINGESVLIPSEDIAEFFEYYDNSSRYRSGYAIFESARDSDGRIFITNAFILKGAGTNDYYLFTNGFPDNYDGITRVHLNSTGEGGLKSAELTISGIWYSNPS